MVWEKVINIAPDKRNSTEIIFTKEPQVTVREIVKPYMQPIDIAAAFRTYLGNGAEVDVKPAPGAANSYVAANASLAEDLYAPASKETQEGQYSPNTPKWGQNDSKKVSQK